jgi:hypothetical protein
MIFYSCSGFHFPEYWWGWMIFHVLIDYLGFYFWNLFICFSSFCFEVFVFFSLIFLCWCRFLNFFSYGFLQRTIDFYIWCNKMIIFPPWFVLLVFEGIFSIPKQFYIPFIEFSGFTFYFLNLRTISFCFVWEMGNLISFVPTVSHTLYTDCCIRTLHLWEDKSY